MKPRPRRRNNMKTITAFKKINPTIQLSVAVKTGWSTRCGPDGSELRSLASCGPDGSENVYGPSIFVYSAVQS
jgi:hypothetical protein